MPEKPPEKFIPQPRTAEEMQEDLLRFTGGEGGSNEAPVAEAYSENQIIDAAREVLHARGFAPGDVLGDEAIRRQVVEAIGEKTGISLSGDELRNALAAVSDGKRKDIKRAA